MNRFAAAGALLPAASTATEPIPLPGQFEPLPESYVLERVAHIVRIHHGVCDKHEILPDDAAETVADARSRHVCGPRVAPWDCGGEQR